MIPKIKRYTKKQIHEAISFWTKILENTSPLIDALVDEYGYDVVFGHKKVVPTLKMLEKIYSIVNIHLFDNKLNPCQIENDKLGKCKSDSAAMEFSDVIYTDSASNPTKYVLLTQIGQDSNGNVFYPPLIYVADETLTSTMSIITLTSMLTHEMIHQYVDENGNGLQKQYDADYKGIPYDPHKGEFTKWMDIANSKHGLNVVEIGSRTTYDSSSADRLKAFAGKDYDVNESDDFSKMQYGVRRIHHENGYIEQRYS